MRVAVAPTGAQLVTLQPMEEPEEKQQRVQVLPTLGVYISDHCPHSSIWDYAFGVDQGGGKFCYCRPRFCMSRVV